MTTFPYAGRAMFFCDPFESLIYLLERVKLYLIHEIVQSLLVVGALDFAEHCFNGVQFRTVAAIEDGHDV